MTDKPETIDIDQAIQNALPTRPTLTADIKVELESPSPRTSWLNKRLKTDSIMFMYWLACGGLLAGYFYFFPVSNGITNVPVIITAACIVVFCFVLIHLMIRYSKSRISDILFKALE